MRVLSRLLKRHQVLAVICLATAAWSFSFGLGAPLAALWLRGAGCADSTVGDNTGTYYLGMAVAAAAVPWLMRRWGNGCIVAGALVSGLTVAVFPWGAGGAWWFPVRLLSGAAGAMSLIPLETYINRDSPPDCRARNFGFYAVALTLGYALGNWVGLEMYDARPHLAFAIGGALAVVAGVLVWGCLPAPARVREVAGERRPLSFRANFLSYGSAWNQGFLEGVMITFMSFHLLSLGMTSEGVGWITSLTVVGVLLFQIPVAWLADRLGRRTVLLACYALVVMGLGLLPACGVSVWLALWLFVIGACSGAFYPLGLALLGERLPDAALDRANAAYLAIECGGCMIGPVITGHARAAFGDAAMFPVVQGALILFLLAWAGLWLHDRCRRGRASEEARPGEPTAPRAAA